MSGNKAEVWPNKHRKLRLKFSSSLLSKDLAHRRNAICDVSSRSNGDSNASSRE